MPARLFHPLFSCFDYIFLLLSYLISFLLRETLMLSCCLVVIRCPLLSRYPILSLIRRFLTIRYFFISAIFSLSATFSLSGSFPLSAAFSLYNAFPYPAVSCYPLFFYIRCFLDVRRFSAVHCFLAICHIKAKSLRGSSVELILKPCISAVSSLLSERQFRPQSPRYRHRFLKRHRRRRHILPKKSDAALPARLPAG